MPVHNFWMTHKHKQTLELETLTLAGFSCISSRIQSHHNDVILISLHIIIIIVHSYAVYCV